MSIGGEEAERKGSAGREKARVKAPRGKWREARQWEGRPGRGKHGGREASEDPEEPKSLVRDGNGGVTAWTGPTALTSYSASFSLGRDLNTCSSPEDCPSSPLGSRRKEQQPKPVRPWQMGFLSSMYSNPSLCDAHRSQGNAPLPWEGSSPNCFHFGLSSSGGCCLPVLCLVRPQTLPTATCAVPSRCWLPWLSELRRSDLTVRTWPICWQQPWHGPFYWAELFKDIRSLLLSTNPPSRWSNGHGLHWIGIVLAFGSAAAWPWVN